MKRLLVGARAVTEALRTQPDRISVVYAAEHASGRARALCSQAQRQGVRVQSVPRLRLDTLARGLNHQGLIALSGDYPYRNLSELLSELPARPLLVALDQVSDPHNFGAIVRSAVAFGADGLITLRDRSSPVTPVVVRSSAGATEHAKIARVTNLARTLTELRERGMQVLGLDPDATQDLESAEYPLEGRVLVVGAEGHGMRRLVRQRCDLLCRIELSGPLGALNAAVAAAVALYISQRERR